MDVYNKIKQITDNYNKVIIMTHKNPDLDGLSSAVCLYFLLKESKKNVFVFKNENITNKAVIKMFAKLDEYNYNIDTVNEKNYNKIIDDSTLLIILDVNKPNLVENKELLNKTKNIIVIDHHINSNDKISNTIYSYINPNLSSIAEFICDYIQYQNFKLSSILSTILLAAIEIDTNSFNIKTSEKTYLTAAYLMKNGADNVIKQELLKEDKTSYLKRQDLLKNSFMINQKTALCIFDNKLYKKEELARTAEELLQFEDVEASYVVGKTSNDRVSISARSLGKVNVEEVMKKLGGGGHITEAAAEIDQSDILVVKKMLIDEVK